ncbi:protein transport protein SEC31 [Austrofundulus limnaeus]|uniref:Protein transport protein SEC31-like n=1 Tax=Austrofundulus limnaeus TaxID=52670 RepID=A0A2I4B3B1_AUSLI|nr:PREDICTED: protein transport protein SEC31-like [Austrofundulus limnaeus]XP_013862251.1 PREDICTED: protein transport protein SEC31-like [Austrofundulus limnaeus]
MRNVWKRSQPVFKDQPHTSSQSPRVPLFPSPSRAPPPEAAAPEGEASAADPSETSEPPTADAAPPSHKLPSHTPY